jgi:hypothetical protein
LPRGLRQEITAELWPWVRASRTPGYPSTFQSVTMANTTNTPKHTDPATKRDEKKNETEIKDKPSGKTVKTQKK